MSIGLGIGLGIDVRGYAAAGGGSVVSAADTFDRTDNASSLGTASDGVVWTQVDAWGISTNKAYCNISTGTGTSGTSAAFRAGITATNYTLSCTVTDAVGQPGLLIRAADISNFYLAHLVWADQSVKLWSYIAGAFVLLNQSAAAQYVQGADVLLTISNNGTTGVINVSVNGGGTIATATAATNKTVTKCGLYMDGPSLGSAARWDNWAIA